MDVQLLTVRPSRTAVVAGPFDLAQLMPSYDAVYGWLRAQSAVKQVGQNIALYRQGREMEVGVEVDRTFDAVGAVRPSELPGGRVASAVHTTGYGDLQRTYAGIVAWCREHGHALTGTVWEIYGDPDDDGHVDVEIRHLLQR